MTPMLKQRMKPIARSIIALAVVFLLSFAMPMVIPSYGLKSGHYFLVFLILLGVSYSGDPNIPRRWYIYYGLLSTAAAFPGFEQLVLYQGGGRRFDPNYLHNLLLLAAFLSCSSLIVGCLSAWAKKWLTSNWEENHKLEDPKKRIA